MPVGSSCEMQLLCLLLRVMRTVSGRMQSLRRDIMGILKWFSVAVFSLWLCTRRAALSTLPQQELSQASSNFNLTMCFSVFNFPGTDSSNKISILLWEVCFKLAGIPLTPSQGNRYHLLAKWNSHIKHLAGKNQRRGGKREKKESKETSVRYVWWVINFFHSLSNDIVAGVRGEN